MQKKILIVLTSHDQLGSTGKKTGFWLEELATPYYIFHDAGVEMSLASPKGGRPPIDPTSELDEFQNEATLKFKADPDAKALLANTIRLSEIKASDFDGIFYPGGLGPLWDLVSNEDSIRLIEEFSKENKPIASVCHGPIVLVNAKDTNNEYIVNNREVAGFSNTEEAAVGLTEVVPLSVENTLIERGGRYTKAEDFTPFARQDGNLITGVRPVSRGA